MPFAKRLEFDNEPIDKSLMKTENNNGPRTESSETNSSNKISDCRIRQISF